MTDHAKIEIQFFHFLTRNRQISFLFFWYLFYFTTGKFFILALTDKFSLEHFLSILADFNSVLVWIISVLPLFFSSTSLFFRFLETVPTTPTKIDILDTLFSFLSRTRLMFVFSISFIFTLCSTGTAKSAGGQVPLFLIRKSEIWKANSEKRSESIWAQVYRD